MLTHRAILDHTEAYSKRLSFTSDDCIVSWLPLYHDMGLIGFHLVMFANRIHAHLMPTDVQEAVATTADEWLSICDCAGTR